MTMTKKQLIDKINQIVSDSVEYETEHKDSGNNYGYYIAENLDSEFISKDLQEAGINTYDLDEDEILDIVKDCLKFKPGHIFLMTIANQDEIEVGSLPVCEIEIQVDYNEIGATKKQVEKIKDKLDSYVGNIYEDCFYCYVNTDSIWAGVVNKKELQEQLDWKAES